MSFRRNESGNVFFTLFGAIALVGVIGVATATLMRGPVGTVMNINNRTKVDSQLQIARKLAALDSLNQPNSGDCDNDGFVEPDPPDTTSPGCAALINGGGCLPTTVGASRTDPWGTLVGYCGWNHGPTTSGSGCSAGLRVGTNDKAHTVIAVISAGPDRVFQSKCVDYNSGSPTASMVQTNAGSDDVVETWTFDEAETLSGGGLWELQSGNPNAITTTKQVDISQNSNFASGTTATFSGNAAFNQNASLNLANGALFLLPDQNSLVNCSAANTGALRRFTSNATPIKQILQICNGAAPTPVWVNVGGAGDSLYLDDLADAVSDISMGANLFLGNNSGNSMVAGAAQNVAVGVNSTQNLTTGKNNVVLGYSAGNAITTETNDILIGDSVNIAPGQNSFLDIGNLLYGDMTAGRIGIGVAAPATTLDVNGSFHASGSAAVGALTAGNTAISGTLGVSGATVLSSTLDVQGSATNSTGTFQINDSLGVSGATALGNNLSVTGNTSLGGTLGVNGNTSLSGDLGVLGFAAITGAVGGASYEIPAVGSGVGLFSDAASGLQLRTAATDRIEILANGRVGIGNATPATELDVGGAIKVGQDLGAGCASGMYGAIRYSSTADQLQICSNTNAWVTVGTSSGGGGGAADYWTQLGDKRLYYLLNNVGVGTATPLATLDVAGNGLWVQGTYTGTAVTPYTGAGTRMFFDPASGAFRAGGVTGTQWDSGSVGNYSTALGYAAIASGLGSFAAGASNTASGIASLALGNQAIASGNNSFALGLNGTGATAYPTVSGTGSFGIFMQDQHNQVLAANNTMALLGGRLIIDPNSPATLLAPNANTDLDVNGNVGATNYCDINGNNCFTAADVSSGIIGAPGSDRDVIFNSGGDLGAANGFVYTSAGSLQMNLGNGQGLLFTGTSYDSTVDNNNGVVLELNHNSAANRQLVIADSQSGNGVRFIENRIDAVDYKTNSYIPLRLGDGLPNTDIYIQGTSLWQSNGNLGIKTTPATALDVAGTIKVADGGEACALGTVGGIRYSSSGDKVQYCAAKGGSYAWTDMASSGTSGAAAAAGVQGDLQFNSGGFLGANANFVWDNTNQHLNIGPSVTGGRSLDVEIANGSSSSPGNTMLIRNLEPHGWSSIDFTGSDGTFAGAIGYGNPSAPTFANTFYLGGHAGRDTVFMSNDTEHMRLTAAGNFGIGTATPNALLNLANPVNTSTQFFKGTVNGADVLTIQYPATGNGPIEFDTEVAGRPLALQSINGGKVGIGTAAPANLLQVVSAASQVKIADFKTTGADAYITLTDSGGSAEISGSSGELQLGGFAAQPIILRNSNYTERIRIASDGKVGIGQPSPATLLDVAGTIKVANGGEACASSTYAGGIRYVGTVLQFCDGTAWRTISSNGSGGVAAAGVTGDVQFNSGGILAADANYFWDATNHRLGLGTTTPAHAVDAEITSGDDVLYLRNKNASAWSSIDFADSNNAFIGSIGYANASASVFPGLFYLGSQSAGGDVILMTKGVERMRLSSAGLVGIGTTAPLGALDIRTPVTATSGYGDGARLVQTITAAANNDTLSALYINPTYVPGSFTGVTTYDLGFNGAAARTIGVRPNGTSAGAGLTVQAGGTAGGTDIAGGDLTLSGGQGSGAAGSNVIFKTALSGTTGTTANAPTEAMRITPNGWVGLGTTAPGVLPLGGTVAPAGSTIFDVSSNNYAMLWATTFSNSVSGELHFNRARGTAASFSPPQAGDRLGGIFFAGASNTTTFSGNTIAILGKAEDNFSPTTLGSYLSIETVPTGGSVRAERLRLTSIGDLGLGTTTPATLLDVAGTIRVANGGETCGSTYAGGIRYVAATLQYCDGTAWETISATGGAAGTNPWSSLTAPAANLAINMAAYTTAFTYNAATGSNNLFTLQDTASNTGTGYLLNVATATGSAANPFHVGAKGADALTVLANGRAGFGTASPLAGHDIQTPITAAAGVAYGTRMQQTLTAAANSDTLYGLYINPTYTPGSYTGVTNYDVAFGGGAARTVAVLDNGTGAGSGLTVQAGSTTGGTDIAGGNLTLSSGQSSGAAGSAIIFKTAVAGATGTTADVPAEAMRVASNGFVGIGTRNPAFLLDVSGTTAVVAAHGYGANAGGTFLGYAAHGTEAAPSAVLLGEDLAFFGGRGYGTTGYPGSSSGGMSYVASENFTDTARGTDEYFYTTPNGTATKLLRMVLSNAGNLGIGTTTPATLLDVAGTVKVANGGETCGSTYAGGIRYTAATLQYCDGTSWQTISSTSGTGGVAAAGSTGQVQFNNAGVLGADSNYFWDNTNKRLGIGTATPVSTVDINGPTGVTTFIGSTSHLGLTARASNSSDYAGIDFMNTAKSATAPLARIASFDAGNGSFLYFGTSANYGNGVTSTGLVIHPYGNVGIGGSPATQAGLDVIQGVTAASGAAYGTRMQQTLTAAANNDALYGLYINPTYTPGSYTGVTNYDVAFGGGAARTVAVLDNGTGAGSGLTVQAGSTTGGTDIAGGNLTLSSGQSSGAAGSAIIFKTAVAGATGTAVRAPAEAMRVASNGYVGIGTAIPSSNLEVYNNSVTYGPQIALVNGATGGHFWILSSDAASNGGGAGAFEIYDSTTTATRFAINTSGSVGIGTTTPYTKLEVAGTVKVGNGAETCGSNYAGGIRYTLATLQYCDGTSWQTISSTSGTGGVAAAGSTGQVQFNNAGVLGADSNYFWDNTNKRLGIGTATPTANLQIGTGTQDLGNAGFFVNGNALFVNGYFGYGAGVGVIATDGVSKPLTFWTNALERMRIDGSGNLGLGTTAPLAGLDVQNGVTAASGVAYGTRLAQTLTAAANSDTLYGLYINPTYTPGSYTGVTDYDLAFGGSAARTIAVMDNGTTAGSGLTVQAGSTTGGTDLAGGNLTLSSGQSSGAAGSAIIFKAAVAGTTGTTARAPAEAMRVASNGNVGIGTTAPGVKLDVNSANASWGIQVDGTLATGYTGVALHGTGKLYSVGVGNASETTYGVPNKFYVFDSSNNAMRLTIDPTGNTGIGTTTPYTLLEVAGTVKVGNGAETCGTNYAGGIRYTLATLQYCDGTSWQTISSTSGTGGVAAAGSTGQVQFNNGGVLGADGNYFWDNTNKRLGIGTATPGYALHVSGGTLAVDSGSGHDYFRLRDATFSKVSGGGLTLDTNLWMISGSAGLPTYAFSSNATSGMFSPGANLLGFATNALEVARFNAAGDFGLGTTTPTGGLDVRTPVTAASGYGDGARFVQTMTAAANNDTLSALYINPTYTPGSYTGVTNYDVAFGGGAARTVAVLDNGTGAGSGLTVQAGSTTGGTDIAGGNLTLSSGQSSGAAGSAIIFKTAVAGATGTTARAPAEAMRVASNGFVGIGTRNPAFLLDVSGTTAVVAAHGYGANAGGTFLGYAAHGTEAAPSAVLLGEDLAFFGGRGYGTTGYPGSSSGGMSYVASENFTDTARGTDEYFYTTPNGTATKLLRMVLSNAGNLGIGTTTPATLLDVAGTVKVANGGETCGSTYAGGIRYTAATLQYCDGTSWETISASGGAAGTNPWSSLTAPTANLAINMAAYTTAFTYNAATGSNNLFTLQDTASNTGTGYLLNVATATGSAANPFHVGAAGTDALTVLANGNVGVGTASPGTPLAVIYNDNSFARGISVKNANAGTTAITGLQLQTSGGTAKANLDYYPSNYQNSSIHDTAAFTTLGSSARLAFITGVDQGALGGADIYFQSGSTNPNLFIKGSSGNLGIGTITPLGALDVQKGVTAASGIAYGTRLQQTLTAAANNDTLYGLYINPTYTPGSFTGVTNYDVAFGGGAARTVAVLDNGTGAGSGLTVQAGSTTGGTDIAGGNLTLSSGQSSGAAGSAIIFKTAVAGATGTTARAPAEAMRIANNGYVGIGAVAPAYPLVATGAVSTTFGRVTAQLSSTANETGFQLSNSGAGGIAWNVLSTANSSGLGGGRFAIGDTTSNSARLVIDSTGNVGINIITPATKLDVAGTVKVANGGETCGSTYAGGIRYISGTLQYCDGSNWQTVSSGGSGGVAAAGSTGYVQFNSGGKLGADSNYFWDNTNKRLGIGTAAPAYTLDVAGTVHSSGAMTVDAGSGNANGLLNLVGRASGVANTTYLQTTYTGGLNINAPQNVLISATSFVNPNGGATLQVYGNEAVGTGYHGTAAPANGLIVQGNVGIGTTTPYTLLEVAGTVKVGNGAETCGTNYAGGIRYTAATLQYCDGTSWETISASGGAAGTNPWSSLTAPTANLAINMAAYTTAFTYNAATGSNNLFTLQDTASNTGTGYLLNVATATGSAANPFHVGAKGVDALTVLANGRAGFGTASPLAGLDVQPGVTAASGVAYGTRLAQTLTAAANNDTLYGLYINPTYTPGSFTGVTGTDLAFGGGAARTVAVLDNGTGAGSGLTVQAGSTTGGTDIAGGNLTLSSGQSSGAAGSAIIFKTAVAGATGTTARAPAEAMRVASNGYVGIGSTAPVSPLDVEGSSANLLVVNNADATTTALYSKGVTQFDAGQSNETPMSIFGRASQSAPLFEVGALTSSQGNYLTVSSTGNVGIGTTTPYTKLEVAGTVKVGNGAETCGSNYAGGIRYTAATLQYCDGTSWETISASGGAAGTNPWSSLTAPTANLALNMAAYTTAFTYNAATGSNNLFTLQDTASNTGTGYLLNVATATGSAANPFHVGAKGNDALTVLANGRAGFGTASPLAGLDIQTPITAASGVAYGTRLAQTLTAAANNDTLYGLYINPTYTPGSFTGVTSYDLAFGGGAARTVAVLDNGTGAGSGLTVQAGSTTGGTDIAGGNLTLSSGQSSGAAGSAIIFDTAVAGATGTAARVPTERMRVASNGFVGIGTSTPGQKLDVSGNIQLSTATPSINFGAGTATTTQLYLNNTATNTQLQIQNTASGLVAGLYVQGNVGIGTTTPATRLDVAGTLKVANGGETCGSTYAGGIRFVSATLQYCDGTAWETVSATGGAAGTNPWSSLTAPAAAETLAMGAYNTTFTWGAATTGDMFTMQDTTGNTGTGYVLNVKTVGTSTANPFHVGAKGVDALTVLANGRAGFGTASPLAGHDIQTGVTAASGVAYGTRMQQTLTAAANNDALYGLYINPTYTPGSFTGVTDYDLAFGGGAARTVAVLDNGTGAGSGLTVQAGSTTGGTDIAGGNLTLSSGQSSGAAGSAIIFKTAVAGATGTTARAPAEAMRVASNGFVGIGTASPSDMLYVYGGNIRVDPTHAFTVSGSGNLTNCSAGTFCLNNSSSTTDITINPNGAERLRVSASTGNVGIGTTTPATKLQVAGTLMVANGGETCGSTYAGGIRYTLATLQYCDGTSWETISASGGAAGTNPWSSLTAPTANLAINMAAYTTAFTYNAATGSNNLFTLQDTASNTGTGYLLNVATATGSAANPFHVGAKGADALTVLANGRVGIGTATPSVGVDILGSTVRIGQVTAGDVLDEFGTTTYLKSSNQIVMQLGGGNNAMSINITGTTSKTGMGTVSPIAAFDVDTPVTAASGVAYGTRLAQTLTAAANNDTLYGLYINPTYTPGAYTGVTNYDVAFAAGAARTIAVMGNGTSAGNGLSLLAGGTAGGTNIAGGDLTLSSGQGTGTAGSNIIFKTSVAGTTGTGSNAVTEAMRVANNGYVGIGTAAPAAMLDVLNPTSAGVSAYQAIGNFAQNVDQKMWLSVRNNNLNGTAVNPFAGFSAEAYDSVHSGYARALFGIQSQTSGGLNGQTVISAPKDIGIFINRGIASDNTAGIYGTQAMAITAAGNAGIGTTNPYTKLEVAGTVKVGNGAEVCGSNYAGGIRFVSATLQYCDGTAWETVSATGGAAGTNPWSSLTAPTANLSLAMAAYTTTWTAGAATSGDMFTMQDTTGNTGTGYVLNVKTVGTSTANPFHVGAKGTDALTVLASGFVGIGTAAPTQLLTVGSSTTRGVIQLNGSSSSAPALHFLDNRSGGKEWVLYSGATGTGDFDFFDVSQNSYPVVIKQGTGLLGLSTSSPLAGLDVQTGVTAASGVAYGTRLAQTLTAAANSDTLYGLYINPTYTVGAFTGVASHTIMMSGGANRDIGVDSPGAGNAGNNLQLFAGWAASGTDKAGGDLVLQSGRGTGAAGSNIIFQNAVAGSTGTTLNAPAEAMRIAANGYVGIGTTTPATRLDVAGTVKVANGGETCGSTYAGGIRYLTGTLQYCDGSNWQTISSSGGSGVAAAGSNTQVQFNSGGVLGASSNFTWSGGNLTASNMNVPTAGAYEIGGTTMLALPSADTTASIAVGGSALASDTTGNSGGGDNTAVGYKALTTATTGTNAAFGYKAGQYISTGTNNTAIGTGAMTGTNGNQLTGGGNTAIGDTALPNLQGGAAGNIGIGYQAGYYASSGNHNTLIGVYSAYNIGGSSDDTTLGYQALDGASAGGHNVAIGNNALYNSTSASNTAVGWFSLATATSGQNAAFGAAALQYATTASYNTAIGSNAMIGVSGTPLTGFYNTGVGDAALYAIQGGASDNTALGHSSGVALTSATDNTLLGFQAGNAITTGNYNVIVGESGNITTGASNILIGNSLASTSATASSQLDIGDVITGTTGTTGKIGIDMSGASLSYTLQVNGSVAGTSGYNNTSDARLKKNVVEIGNALDLVGRLRGVRFDWRMPAEREVGRNLNLPVGVPQIGFIAQEVQTVLPEAVTHGSDGIYTIEESKMTPVLVEAVKQLKAENDGLRRQVAGLQADKDQTRQAVADLQKQVDGMKAYTGYGVHRAGFDDGWLLLVFGVFGGGAAVYAWQRRRRAR